VHFEQENIFRAGEESIGMTHWENAEPLPPVKVDKIRIVTGSGGKVFGPGQGDELMACLMLELQAGNNVSADDLEDERD
jgi:hypothetical protein